MVAERQQSRAQVQYRPASGDAGWWIAVEDAALAVLAPSVTAQTADAVWRRLGDGGIGAVLDALTGAFGTSLTAIPPFALVVVEAGGVRIAVRGALDVIVDAAGAPIGYVHLKDVLRAAEGTDASNNVDAPIRPKRIHHMVPVAETTDLEDALALMRRSGRHLAQVRNASGEVTGVLFLEDIIEELVGEVHDATRRGH